MLFRNFVPAESYSGKLEFDLGFYTKKQYKFDYLIENLRVIKNTCNHPDDIQNWVHILGDVTLDNRDSITVSVSSQDWHSIKEECPNGVGYALAYMAAMQTI